MSDRDMRPFGQEEKKYAQISNESIQTWAETIGVSDLSPDILHAVASDSTYRLHQILNVSSKFLTHNNREKLTTEDINRALKWMDVPPVYGYSGSEVTEWVSIPELGIHIPHDPAINLSSTALSGDIFHQPGSCYVRAKWVHVSGHLIMKSENNGEDKVLSSLPLPPELTQYYRTLFSVITSPSKKLFKTMCEDVGSSANIEPLVGPIIDSVLKGAQKARQKPLILRRLLLIIRALLTNPHIHLGPQDYIHDIVNFLVFSVVTERKNPQDTQSIRTLAANILLQLSRNEGEVGTAWELAVTSLSGVVGSSTRPWTQHAGALTGLMPLGFSALYRTLSPIASDYYDMLSLSLANSPSVSISSAISAKDTLDANMTAGLLLGSFVNMMVHLTKRLPDSQKIIRWKKGSSKEREVLERGKRSEATNVLYKLHEIYFLGEEMFGSAFVLQVPTLYLCWEKTNTSFREKGSTLEDLIHSKRTKRIGGGHSANDFFSSLAKKISMNQIFESYRLIIPVRKRKIYMCIRGCSTRNFEYLKKRKGTIPDINQHPNRMLLIRYNKIRMLGRMPHWTFIHPVFPPIRPCSSLTHLIL